MYVLTERLLSFNGQRFTLHKNEKNKKKKKKRKKEEILNCIEKYRVLRTY